MSKKEKEPVFNRKDFFMSPEMSCEGCKFWRGFENGEELGQCYRYPPVFDPSWLQEQLNASSDLEFSPERDACYWVHTVTDAYSFCGEYIARYSGALDAALSLKVSGEL